MISMTKGASFRANRAWEALDIALMNGISTRLHWTDQPYHWHINEGDEVFVVLAGRVDMHYREQAKNHSVELHVGDIFYASEGTEHIAYPIGEARILVIEHAGSI